jgi:hypothetical protein
VTRRRGVRRYRFGNGGNPPLSAMMGSEFCSGGGGVLGANSTGLFPTPCMTAGPKAAFGKRRRRRGSRMYDGNMNFGKRRRRVGRPRKTRRTRR